MEDSVAIHVTALDKQFDQTHAVKGIHFDVRRGEIFSLLGPNGAGKSTTISMICGLIHPNGGDATIMGHSISRQPQAAKAALGVVPQDIAVYEDLTARENLEFWGKMYGLRGPALTRRIDDVLDLIGLAERQKERVGQYSGGMKRRVNIGVALLHEPAVIIMDEPTVGIDPQSRRHILDGVKTLHNGGVTVLYTTHYMEEAQELSDHIAIMDQGEIIACGTHEELVRIVGEQDRIELQLDRPAPDLIGEWQAVPSVRRVTSENGTVTVLAPDSNHVLPDLFERASEHQVRITNVAIQEPNLETVFLHLTGRALRD